MAICAATCPCCGRDIGFDETVREYTCIFCGATLITAALTKEKLDGRGAAGASSDAAESPVPPQAERPHRDRHHPEHHHHEHHHREHGHAPLSDEERKDMLIRKTRLKQELRDIVKEIDVLRSRRSRYKTRLKLAKALTAIGAIFTAAALIIVFFVLDSDFDSRVMRLLVAAASAFLCGATLIITAAVVKAQAKRSNDRLEDTISNKKKLRDGLIGKLDRISSRLESSEQNNS